LTTGSLGARRVGPDAGADAGLTLYAAKQSSLGLFENFDVGVTGAHPENLERTLGGLF
jgi:hypothetical protein